jgi:hypothetical protein
VSSPRPFLTAQWRDLIFLNYEVPATLLTPLVPAGTTLDVHNGRLFASIVGFRFLDTAIRGWPVPLHGAFEEVNLRFYVRRDVTPTDVRRAVVFIKELVPKVAVAAIARLAYNEPYRVVPMWHQIVREERNAHPTTVSYHWRLQRRDYAVEGRLGAPTTTPEAKFITEHYWGYTRQRDGATLEYQVLHPAWAVEELMESHLGGDLGLVYGPAWAEILEAPPCSAFYANGSAISVLPGQRL